MINIAISTTIWRNPRVWVDRSPKYWNCLVLSADTNFSRIFCGITHTYMSTCRNSNLYVKEVKFTWHYFLFTCENIQFTCEVVFFFLTFLQDESKNSNNNAAQHLCQSLQFLFFGLFRAKISNRKYCKSHKIAFQVMPWMYLFICHFISWICFCKACLLSSCVRLLCVG